MKVKPYLAEKTVAQLRREIKWLQGHIKNREAALVVKLRRAKWQLTRAPFQTKVPTDENY